MPQQAGSGEILRAVTLAFTGPGKALVSASPTFESPARTAQGTKADVRAIPVAPDGTLDLKAMTAASAGRTGLCLQPEQPHRRHIRPRSTTRISHWTRIARISGGLQKLPAFRRSASDNFATKSIEGRRCAGLFWWRACCYGRHV
jgi:hypothetical protein